MLQEQIYPWLGNAPEYDEATAKTYETDVIVCGAGIAGVSAVRSAAEAGADCILFEKCTQPQGRSGQFAITGGNFIHAWDENAERYQDAITECLWQESGYQAKRSMLQYAVRHLGIDFDWYLEGLPKEDTFIAHNVYDVSPEPKKLRLMVLRYPRRDGYDPAQEAAPTYPYTASFSPSHVPVLYNNLKLAEATGHVRTFFSSPVRKLLQDETGRVTGVLAETYDGTLIRALARKGVILATGDYAGSPDMLKWFFPDTDDQLVSSCGIAPDKSKANSGDGHRMGMWAGAKLETVPHCISDHQMGGSMGVTPFLQLNLRGERFMNEDISGQRVEFQIKRQPEAVSWQFFDSDWKFQIPFMPEGHGACSHVIDDDAIAAGTAYNGLRSVFSCISQSVIDRDVAAGKTLKADTLEELIGMTGLPAEQALASIRRYNELADNGKDLDFGKKACRMFALRKGPFYAVKMSKAHLLCIHSGLESDETCRCYRMDGSPIPGLYAAGNVQGGRFAGGYPTTIPGFSHSSAITFGRKAGLEAANAAPL